MKFFLAMLTTAGLLLAAGSETGFLEFSKNIDSSVIKTLPVQNNGRIKPFDTLAREVSLYLTGKRSPFGLSPAQFYLGLIVHPKSDEFEFIQIRNKEVRTTLGFEKAKQYYSLTTLRSSSLSSQVKPVVAKERENRRSLTPLEKDLLEVYQQYNVAEEVRSGNHFLSIVDFSVLSAGHHEGHGPVIGHAKTFLQSLASGANEPDKARALVISALEQSVPPLFSDYRKKIGLEVSFNQWRPFLISGILYFCLGAILLFGLIKKVSVKWVSIATLIPFAFLFAGFATRVYITGFAPVTNMYTTMLWVAFGVSLFSLVLLVLYKNYFLVGFLNFGTSLILILTESFPLILSPDLDPIVAVLRSNYWLTLHVLTVTISYAAFTICMLIGNFALFKTCFGKVSDEFYRTYSHYAYRMAQLGVCLITAGIILGGIWADYSWGRFWGWDPKETWALIADLGFLAILHARYIGWLKPFGVLASMPIAYLLVIMAWYGVNFVLAAGLHSYGFSSGGAAFVSLFVTLQTLLIAVAVLRKKQIQSKVSRT